MTEREPRTALVLGATGNQGSAVTNALLNANSGWSVRAGTRDPSSDRARALAERSVEVVRVDMDDAASLVQAMVGAEYLFFVPIVAGEGPPSEIARGSAVVDAAAEAGVRHIVFSGVAGGNRQIGVPNFESKGAIERHIRSTGLHYTVIRPVSFMENFNRNRDAILSGRLSGVLDPTKVQQYVSVRDIAAFAIAALEDPARFDEHSIDLAGDQLTMPELASTFARVLGRDVSYSHIPPGDARSSIPPPMLVMNEFFEREGYGVDIPALRTRWGIPLTSMEDWIRSEPDWLPVDS